MPTAIFEPTRIQAAGNKPKLIDEFIGRVNSKIRNVSIAHMRSPEGWEEPGQTPEFDEYTIVLKGMMRVTHKDGSIDIRAGQAVIAHKGEWVRYSTPDAEERNTSRSVFRRFRSRRYTAMSDATRWQGTEVRSDEARDRWCRRCRRAARGHRSRILANRGRNGGAARDSKRSIRRTCTSTARSEHSTRSGVDRERARKPMSCGSR